MENNEVKLGKMYKSTSHLSIFPRYIIPTKKLNKDQLIPYNTYIFYDVARGCEDQIPVKEEDIQSMYVEVE